MAAHLKRRGLWFFATGTTKEPSFPLLWIHPHLGLVSYFQLSFLIWFSSDVGVSATANMYKHATLHYIYFL